MKTVTVTYDSTSGMVYDERNIYLGTITTHLVLPSADKAASKALSVDQMIKMKAAGFTAEEIVMLSITE